MGDRIRRLDPYGHPISSRFGGGSGSSVMKHQSYVSVGSSGAKINTLTKFFLKASVPVSVDDNWGEQFRRGKFSPGDIRRAFWKLVLEGGLGSHVRDDRMSNFNGAKDPDAWFHIKDMGTKLESEQWLRLVNPFVQTKLGDIFGVMAPGPSLVGKGYALADPARSKILVLSIGKIDRFDRSKGGPVVIKLSSLMGNYSAFWFDPRTGREIPIGILAGGVNYTLVPPSTDDWLLLLTRKTEI